MGMYSRGNRPNRWMRCGRAGMRDVSATLAWRSRSRRPAIRYAWTSRRASIRFSSARVGRPNTSPVVPLVPLRGQAARSTSRDASPGRFGGDLRSGQDGQGLQVREARQALAAEAEAGEHLAVVRRVLERVPHEPAEEAVLPAADAGRGLPVRPPGGQQGGHQVEVHPADRFTALMPFFP